MGRGAMRVRGFRRRSTATVDRARAALRASRRLPFGAEVTPGGQLHFRVWAPSCERVEVVFEGPDLRASFALEREEDGFHCGGFDGGRPGTRYRLRLDGEDTLHPDPASRYQPEGPFGPSEIVDPTEFAWTDDRWRGLSRDGQVLYEMHVGTFTHEGTWEAARRELPALAELGITAIEVMPVADFAGEFGWGYDGVCLFAPTRLYGPPDGFRRFVDSAHAAGMGVILDVVYNHVGPSGLDFKRFSDTFFSDRYENEWGEPINFDGEGSAPVRQFFVANARYWIEEFHLDGLRIDATQQMFDSSRPHIVNEITRAAREAAEGRSVLILAENEPQEARVVRSAEEEVGYGADALWNDDFHHSAVVAATGRREAYYTDHRGTPQELISAAKWGFLYQGQWYSWQKKTRGTSALDLPSSAFVNYLENHDQVANTARGLRLHEMTTPGRYRALTALLLLSPGTPLLFQGQEFGSTAPFTYFADHGGELGKAVKKGRADFMRQFKRLSGEGATKLPDPTSPDTFRRCKLDAQERESNVEHRALHRELLRLRREHVAFSQQRGDRLFGAVVGPEAFALRFFVEEVADERLLVVNLGATLELVPQPEPLLAPPDGTRWTLLWSSDDPRYGGDGVTPLPPEGLVEVPAHSAIVLAPEESVGG